MQGISGKVVIVTGGAGGPYSVGAEIVRGFHQAGAKVVIADINGDAAASLAVELGEGAIAQTTDITSDAQLQALVDAAVAAFGGIDFIINSAASYDEAGMDSSREQLLKGIDVNTVSAAMLTNLALEQLQARGGAVVNFGSISGKVCQFGRFMYAISKAANLHMTKIQAAQLAGAGVRVNCVSPGWTWSDPIGGATEGNREKADSIGATMHPLGKIGDQADVANACLFLCSDAACHITGVDLPVDGGYMTLGPEQQIGSIEWLTS
jgi:NAD(P)-dependent dehydrogenase (short-subunit alcohol dehydrogenase family)